MNPLTNASAPTSENRSHADAGVASTEEIRSHFPALLRRHGGGPVAYFDGPGGTQTPRAVAEAVIDYLYCHNANTHWAYPTSVETDEMLARARGAMADLLNASPGEIVFGANSTTLAYHVARTLGRTLSASDEIVVTELDHHANVGPWLTLERERGVTLRTVRMNVESGELDWNDFERTVTPRTKVVAIGAASNALGTVNDVVRATKLARSVGAWSFVDGVHFVPHRLADVQSMDCDFLTCSAYKFYGPHVGTMFIRRELLQTLPFPKLAPAPDTAPERAETGTLNHEGIAGVEAAVDFLSSLAGGGTRRQRLQATLDALDRRGNELTGKMWDGLSEIDGVRLYGPPLGAQRTSTLAFTLRGVPARVVAQRLGERGVFVSSGDFYATTVVARLGLTDEGLVRAGCACYTTSDEVDRLVAGVRAIVG